MSLEDSLYPMLKAYSRLPQWLRSTLGSSYRMLPTSLRYGSSYTAFRRLLDEAKHWDAKQIRQYQLSALRASLIAAGKTSYYATRFAQLGLRPEKLESLEQLSAYPLLTKRELQQNRERMVNRDLRPAKRLYMTTGGSTGVPVGFYLHKGVSRAKEQVFLEAQWSKFGYHPGDRVAMLRGTVTDARSGGRISSYDGTRNWLVLSSYHLTAERVPEYVAELNRFKPKHLHAYPSAALMLARGMEQAGLKLKTQLKSLLCGSEKLSTADRQHLEKTFSAPACHWYGHSERVVLAGNVVKSAELLKPHPLYGYMELDDEDEEGWCEIIGTSFHNEVMPLIRYCTGDRARVLRAEDGSFVITEMAGRSHEFLIGKRGRRISLTAMNMHDSLYDGLLALQFHQVERGVLELRYVPGADWHSSRETGLHQGVMAKLGDDFELSLCAVDEVETTAAGKRRWVTGAKD
jgi:phenylacetate-CoA ligase